MKAMIAEKYRSPDVLQLKEVDKPVAEAHRYVDKGHKKGNVIINI